MRKMQADSLGALVKMAQTLGRVGRQMEDVFKLVFRKQLLDQFRVGYRTFHKLHIAGNMVAKPAAQIVQPHDGMALSQQMPANVGPDEAGGASDQNL